jgi:hypothetical protein
MKIRFNYVSNSSSSSCVIAKFDFKLILSLIDKFIETIDFNDDYEKFNKSYKTNKELVKQCFIDKLNESKETQEEYIDTYLCNSIYCMFESYADYCINTRSIELTCKDCKDCCDRCYIDWVKRTADNDRSEYQQEMENFKEFDFTKDFENIKSIVCQSDTEEINGQMKVNVNCGHLYNLFDELCDKYTNKWIELHPEFYVLSFASDEGSYEQALIRNNICELVEFMKENGIESFRGENS